MNTSANINHLLLLLVVFLMGCRNPRVLHNKVSLSYNLECCDRYAIQEGHNHLRVYVQLSSWSNKFRILYDSKLIPSGDYTREGHLISSCDINVTNKMTKFSNLIANLKKHVCKAKGEIRDEQHEEAVYTCDTNKYYSHINMYINDDGLYSLISKDYDPNTALLQNILGSFINDLVPSAGLELIKGDPRLLYNNPPP